VRPRTAAGVLVAAAMTLPAAAQQASTGAEAFARRDFVAAAELWRGEAAAGSAEAKLGLGLLSDLGLGVPRDAARALRWYLEAADEGVTDAQFNVAVMLDAGTGVPREVGAAAVWYGRAAANGHHRAQYNLGLLYEAGDGVPRNADLARHWLGRAAEALPAAAERLAGVAPDGSEPRSLAAPVNPVGAVVTRGGARRAELVWTAFPGPPGAGFLLEVARLPAAGETTGAIILSTATEASAWTVGLPGPSGEYAWRVSRVSHDESRYAAAPWQPLGEGSTAGLPRGRVALQVAAEDAGAGRMAGELADSFTRAGLWVRVEPATDAAEESGVRFAYREDGELAASVAEFLPALAAADAVLSPELSAAPGEIVVRLVGGP
jgi:hypothetical protein